MDEQRLNLFVEIIGWVGSIAILLAYGLNSYQKIKSNSLTFLLLNLSGGVFLIAYSLYKDAYANIFINLVWVVIAVLALGKLAWKKNIDEVKS
jgi:hypothetical protein